MLNPREHETVAVNVPATAAERIPFNIRRIKQGYRFFRHKDPKRGKYVHVVALHTRRGTATVEFRNGVTLEARLGDLFFIAVGMAPR